MLKRFRRPRERRPRPLGETTMNTNDYWVVRSVRHGHESKPFSSEQEAIAFAASGDVLAHVVNNQEISHRPLVK